MFNLFALLTKMEVRRMRNLSPVTRYDPPTLG